MPSTMPAFRLCIVAAILAVSCLSVDAERAHINSGPDAIVGELDNVSPGVLHDADAVVAELEEQHGYEPVTVPAPRRYGAWPTLDEQEDEEEREALIQAIVEKVSAKPEQLLATGSAMGSSHPAGSAFHPALSPEATFHKLEGIVNHDEQVAGSSFDAWKKAYGAAKKQAADAEKTLSKVNPGWDGDNVVAKIDQDEKVVHTADTAQIANAQHQEKALSAANAQTHEITNALGSAVGMSEAVAAAAALPTPPTGSASQGKAKKGAVGSAMKKPEGKKAAVGSAMKKLEGKKPKGKKGKAGAQGSAADSATQQKAEPKGKGKKQGSKGKKGELPRGYAEKLFQTTADALPADLLAMSAKVSHGMHKMPDGTLMDDKAMEGMHKMPDGSWMRDADMGLTHMAMDGMHRTSKGEWVIDHVADEDLLETHTKVSMLQRMHEMPDGSWMRDADMSDMKGMRRDDTGKWVLDSSHKAKSIYDQVFQAALPAAY